MDEVKQTIIKLQQVQVHVDKKKISEELINIVKLP